MVLKGLEGAVEMRTGRRFLSREATSEESIGEGGRLGEGKVLKSLPSVFRCLLLEEGRDRWRAGMQRMTLSGRGGMHRIRIWHRK